MTRTHCLLMLLLAGCVPDGSIRDESTGSDEIIGGWPSVNPSVTAILHLDQDGNVVGICSSVIASPQVILTAAHCVDPRVIGENRTFLVSTGFDLTEDVPDDFFEVSEAYFDEEFDPTNFAAGHDYGALVLAAPIGLPPARINRRPLRERIKNSPSLIVGYGVNEHDPDQIGAGVKRETITFIAGFDEQFLWFGDPEAQQCRGDSGGPAFAFVGSRLKVVGLSSFSFEFAGSICNFISLDARTDVGAAFFDPIIEAVDGEEWLR